MADTNPKRGGARRALLWTVGALATLTLLAWGALAILFPPVRVRALVQVQLARSLTREVRFGEAGVGLLPPVRLTVASVALAEPGGFARGTAFQAHSILLDLDVLRLLGGRVVVKRLILDHPAVHLVLAPDGTTNFDRLVKPAPPGAPSGARMDFTVDEFDVRQGRLVVDDVKVQARRTLVVDTKIALASEARGKRTSTSGTTVLSGLAFGPLSAARISDLNWSLAKLEARVEHRGAFDAERKRLALEKLDVVLGRARLGLVGVVDDPGPRARFDLRARGSGVDFGDVLGYLAAADAQAVHGVQGSGRMDFDLAIRGGLGRAAGKIVVGTLSVADAAFRYPGAPAGVDRLRFTARFAPDSVGIGDLAASVSGQPVRAQLALTRFRDPLVRFALQGNVDLAAAGPLVAPKDTKLGGRVGLDVRGSGRAKDVPSMAVGGTARLVDVSVESPQVPKRIERVNGTVRFSQVNATISGLTAHAGPSAIALDAGVTRPLALLAKPGSTAPSQMNFDFRSPSLDLADVLPPQSGPPIVLNATGVGRVSIGRLRNQKLDVQALRADVRLEPGIVNAPSFSMHAYQGRVSGSARLDLRDAANPVITLKSQLDSLSADALVSTWTPAKSFLQGSLNTALDFSVEGATPEQMKRTVTAVGLATVLRGQVGPGPVLAEISRVVHVPGLERLKFDQAQLPFRVERGRVISNPVVLRGGYGEWRIVGAVGFDGALDYAVSATLPPAATQALAARSAIAAGALTDANGNLLLDLRVTGTAKAPRVAWDPSAMKGRMLGRASEALQAQQQKLETELRQAALARQQAMEDSARRAVRKLMLPVIPDTLRHGVGDVLKSIFRGGRDTTRK